MKRTIIRYGVWSMVVLTSVTLLGYLVFGTDEPENFKLGEIIGYSAIVGSLLFVFFGIRHYRDHENEGRLNFSKGLKLGLLITLFPAFIFAIYNYMYVEIIDPDFTETYYNHLIEQAKVSSPPERLQDKINTITSQKEMFSNTYIQSLLMFFTVFIIGTIITLLSALFLKK
jgi:hypothetical protein